MVWIVDVGPDGGDSRFKVKTDASTGTVLDSGSDLHELQQKFNASVISMHCKPTCPHCGGTHARSVTDWKASSKEEPALEHELQEWQCDDCCRSFWL